MNTILRAGFSLILVLLAAMPAQAQAPRRSNFNRVTTSRGDGPAGSVRSGAGIGYTETSIREAAPADPLRAYTSRPEGLPGGDPAMSLGSRERRVVPAISAPTDRGMPRSYYPSLRTGQGPNRNVGGRGHCTGSRGSFIARGGMGMSPGMGMGSGSMPR